jgi:outer membrane receptor protein involved in Fe transport
MSGAVEYTRPLGRWGYLAPRFSFSWKDDVFFDPSEGRGALGDLPDGSIAQSAFWLFHAGLTYRDPSERLEITGWIRNITDEAYVVQSFDLSEDLLFLLDVYGEPRTFGVTVSVSY